MQTQQNINNYQQIFNDLYSRSNNIFESQKQEGEKQICWAVLMQSGLIGGYDWGNMYLSPEALSKRAKNFIGCPIDLNHDNNSIGTVLDVVFNDKGITTESGVFIEPNFEWMAKFEIPANIDINKYGVSTQYTPEKKVCENGEINDIQCAFEVVDLQPKFLSIVDKETARYDASNEIYNSNNQKKFDNFKSSQPTNIVNNFIMEEKEVKNNDFSMEEVKNFMSEIKNSIEEVKNLCATKNSSEEVKTETKEEEKKEVENSDESKLDEILSLLKQVLSAEKKEVENSDDEKKDNVEEIKNASSNVKMKQNTNKFCLNDDFFN